jgi:hypothetical protein
LVRELVVQVGGELSKRLIEHALGCSEPDFTQC